jgi:hypothetical protein
LTGKDGVGLGRLLPRSLRWLWRGKRKRRKKNFLTKEGRGRGACGACKVRSSSFEGLIIIIIIIILIMLIIIIITVTTIIR